MNLADELKVARVAGAGYRPECSASEASIGIIQRRRVRYIENFRAELKVHGFANPKSLPDHQIRILQPGPSHRVAGTGSDSKLGRRREGGYIKVFRHTPIGKVIGIADSVRPLDRVPQGGIVIRGLCNGHGVTRLNPD